MNLPFLCQSPMSVKSVALAVAIVLLPSEFMMRAQAGAETPGFNYERHEITLKAVQRLTVLTGFFFEGTTAQLAALHIDESNNRRLRLYSYSQDVWMPTLRARLAQDVLFVDVANIGGRDRLLTYRPGALSWLDPNSANEHALATMVCTFKVPRENEIPHVDVTHDINGDGRDDVVVPGVDGFSIYVQRANGEFAEPIMVACSTDFSRIYGSDGYRFDPWSQSRVHKVDFNHDGRHDLVYWNGHHLAVHFQNERGLFAADAEAFSVSVAFDSDDLSSLAAGEMTGRVLHSISDMNGDGVSDLVVATLDGNRVSRKRSSYDVHFGKPTPGGHTEFAPQVGLAFQSDGKIQIDMERIDFDGDGQLDVMLTTIDTRFLSGSLWKSLKGLMGDDVWLELEFYGMDAGRFSNEPNARQRIALDGAPSHREPGWVPLDLVLRGGRHERKKLRKRWPRAFNMLLRVGDVTGDNRSDLMIGKNSPNGLDVLVGVNGWELFSRSSQDVPVVVPNDEEFVWLVDINRDGKQDLLMHDPFTLRDAHGAPIQPPGTEPHRVTILVAR